MQPFLGLSKAAEDNQVHLGLHLSMFPPKIKKDKKKTHKNQAKGREEIATKPN